MCNQHEHTIQQNIYKISQIGQVYVHFFPLSESFSNFNFFQTQTINTQLQSDLISM